MVVADHVQKVLKTNFAASWEEIGDSHEMKDTYALSQMKSLEGKVKNTPCEINFFAANLNLLILN